jgi:hypothetical protein
MGDRPLVDTLWKIAFAEPKGGCTGRQSEPQYWLKYLE